MGVSYAVWEERAARLLMRIDGMDEAQRRRSVGGSFNAVDTVEHLALVDEYYFPLIEKFDRVAWKDRPSKPRVFYKFAVNGMRKKRRLRMPTIREMTPSDAAMPWEAARKHFVVTQARMKSLLDDVPMEQVVMKHPIFGYLSKADLVTLWDAHLEYHLNRLPLD